MLGITSLTPKSIVPTANPCPRACVVLAGVGSPPHGGVRRDGPKPRGSARQRCRLHAPRRRRPRLALAAWQRIAPLERELNTSVIVGALTTGVVRHVPRELILEVAVAAREAKVREELVGAEVILEA